MEVTTPYNSPTDEITAAPAVSSPEPSIDSSRSNSASSTTSSTTKRMVSVLQSFDRKVTEACKRLHLTPDRPARSSPAVDQIGAVYLGY